MIVRIQPVTGADPDSSDQKQVGVVIDALRASVTIATALTLGARKVVPVSSLEEAKELKQTDQVLIAGERGGKWMEGFDFGNSPGQLLENAERIKGTVLVLTTSNGTGTILRAARAGEVLIGCLPNLAALVKKAHALALERQAEIVLYPAGWLGKEAEEDLYTALVMGRELARLGAEFDPAPEIAALGDRPAGKLFLECEAGQRLIGLGYREDVLRCAEIDTYRIVPVHEQGALRIG